MTEPKKNRGGRPRLYDESMSRVTVMLDEATLSMLNAIDNNRSAAIRKAVARYFSRR